MLISKINTIENKVSYKSASPKNKNSNRKKEAVIVGIAGLSLIGAATAGRAILNLHNTSPALILKSKLRSLSNKFASQPQKDPIVRILDGDRSAEAVKRYEALRAQAKINNFSAKYLNGNYADKSGKDLHYISKNIDKLKRTASRVI